MQGLGTSDYMGSAHWQSAAQATEDPDDAYPFVRSSFFPMPPLPYLHSLIFGLFVSRSLSY
jgi:hypothetical protein